MQNNTHEEKHDTHYLGGILAGLLFLAALLLGGLIGAAVMLLLAPQSGKKTRAQIRRKGRDWREQTVESVEDVVAQVRAKTNQTVTSLRQQANELEQRGQAMLDEGGSRFSASH